jgi:ABC-2 type transport system permease protein
MSWRGVKAVLMQDAYVTKASLEVIFDIFIVTLINIMLFGFISNYFSEGSNNLRAESLLVAIIFWEVIRINQYSISVSSMWNVWSHNLSNMFIAPIKVSEYLLAHFISATFKSLFVLISAIALAHYVFDINILDLGLFPVLFSYFNMVIFGTAVGFILIGFVFQYGTRIQAVTWGTIYLLQPLCAIFFPVQVLPVFIQPIAYTFPVTYFFEWLRALHAGETYSTLRILGAFCLNCIFLLVCSYVFSRQLAASKRSGQLVRNEL